MTNGAAGSNHQRRTRFRLYSSSASPMPRRSDDNERDFVARAIELKAMAEQHRLRAETAADDTWKSIHHKAAESYDNLAADMEKLVQRLASIDRAIARAEAQISERAPAESDRE
jgi:hypothetical protein